MSKKKPTTKYDKKITVKGTFEQVLGGMLAAPPPKKKAAAKKKAKKKRA